MPSAEERVFGAVHPQRAVSLTQALIRLPSPLWEETLVAHYLAGYMGGLGMEVDVQSVPVPGGRVSHQAIGRLRGTAGEPSLMLCGHTDTSRWGGRMYREELWTRDPWGGELDADGHVYGLGAHNMKGGLAAGLEAVTALVESGVKLRGDVVLAGVIAETGGGVGALHLLKSGLRTQMAIVMEASALQIITVSVGSVGAKITVCGRLRHRLPHANPCEKVARIITALGSTYQPVPEGGWMRFTPHPEMPGYPRMAVRALESGTDWCSLFLDVRIVPGQSEDMVRADLAGLLQRLRNEDPELQAELSVPAAPDIPNMPAALGTPADHPLVGALASAHEKIHGHEPRLGSGYRLGYTADSGHFKMTGIASVEYGPGDTPVWPMTDERVKAADVGACAQVLALAAVRLCG